MDDNGWGWMYDYMMERFEKMYLDHRKGWSRLDTSGWAEVARLADILCKADGIARSKVMLRIPDDCDDDLMDPCDIMEEFSSGSVEDVFYERQERHGGKLYSVFMAPDDLAGRFFAKALSLGYEGRLVNSGAQVGG